MKSQKRMSTTGHQRKQRGRQATPEWASGLRRLYDQVVEEPLPDSFARLLDDLDGADA